MVEQQLLTLKWLPTFGLAVVSLVTDSATGMNWGWYCALNQPPWDYKGNYPTHFFFLIGLGLNIGIGISSYAVWKEGEGAAVPLGLYGAQLVLQWAYLPLLMGCKSVGWSLVDISFATSMAAATTALFKKIDQRTFRLMVPYVVFLGLANLHTLALYAFNRENKPIGSLPRQGQQTLL